jgi:hypothetical protein
MNMGIIKKTNALKERQVYAMAKCLYILGVTVLIFTCFSFVFYSFQFLQGTSQNKYDSGTTIVEKFQMLGTNGFNDSTISPLIEEASEFALYLNPPVPPKPLVSEPVVRPQPVYRPPAVTAKFRLLSTSCYLTNPQKSLALVSEPGKGDHWIRKGERVGNFVVERIEKGAMFYHDGNQIYKMNVTVPKAPQISKVISPQQFNIQEPEKKSESEANFSTESIHSRTGLSNTVQSAGFAAIE